MRFLLRQSDQDIGQAQEHPDDLPFVDLVSWQPWSVIVVYPLEDTQIVIATVEPCDDCVMVFPDGHPQLQFQSYEARDILVHHLTRLLSVGEYSMSCCVTGPIVVKAASGAKTN